MKYKIEMNSGLMQYPYALINKETGHTVDNCLTLIGCLILLCKTLLKDKEDKK